MSIRCLLARLLWLGVVAPAAAACDFVGLFSRAVSEAWLAEVFSFSDPAKELPMTVRCLRSLIRLAQQGSGCRWLPRP